MPRTERVAGFELSLIEDCLRNNFGYNGDVDRLNKETDGYSVRLYSEELDVDVSIVRRIHYELKHVVAQSYISQGKRVIMVSDSVKKFSMVGFRAGESDG